MRLNISSAKWRPLSRASMTQNAYIYIYQYSLYKWYLYVRRHVPFYDWWLSWQRLHNLNDSLQTTLYCHIDTRFVTCSLWICHYELLYIYGINDVWILNLAVRDHLSWETAKFSGCFIQVSLFLFSLALIWSGQRGLPQRRSWRLRISPFLIDPGGQDSYGACMIKGPVWSRCPNY